MSTPVSELPKISPNLAEEVLAKKDLHHVETQEKNVLPTKEDVAQEKQHDALCETIENFSKEKALKHAETAEKVVLPSPDDIKQEKQHQELTQNIEQFDGNKLKQVNTEEKVVLPSKEDLAREKALDQAANFDHSQLKHVEPKVTTNVEVIEA